MLGSLSNSLLLLLASFALTFAIMPKIISVVKYKRLMDSPNDRSSHQHHVPSLGGIAFYIVLILGLYFLNQFDKEKVVMSIIPGLLILFIIGLKDDLVVLSPLTKIIAQSTAICFILLHPSFQIHHLHGFLGIGNVSLYIIAPLTAFIMLAIINAYNLIDGIDGLASIVGIVIFSILSVLFYLLKMDVFFGICILMIGSLFAFLRFNLSSKYKIFMGDTGSLLIGFVIATLVVRLFATSGHSLKALPFQMENLPLVIMAILVVPFFDTARVFTIRIINKKGPFTPDRNHIHHLLIDSLHLSHRKASFLIGIINVLFILIFVLLSSTLNNFWLLIAMFSAIIIMVYFFYRINFSYRNLRRRLLFKKRTKQFKGISNLF